jgi:hypothetical protein
MTALHRATGTLIVVDRKGRARRYRVADWRLAKRATERRAGGRILPATNRAVVAVYSDGTRVEFAAEGRR